MRHGGPAPSPVRKNRMNRPLLLLTLLIRSVALAGHWAALRLRLLFPPPRARSGSRPLVVLYSQVAWHGVWQRPQELAAGLAERGWRVLYVAPMQIHETLGRFRQARRTERPRPSLTVFTPAIFSGEYKSGAIFGLNKRLVADELRLLLRGEEEITAFCNTPLAEPVLARLRARRLVYDVMDDFTAFDWSPRGAQAMENRLLKRADAVFTGTHALLEKTAPARPDATFVPCGVNFERFYRDPQAPAEPLPEDLHGLPRPLIGYAGTLSERVDPRILRDLAEAFPRASIVLIGPVYCTLGPPPQAPNIHYLGLKPHEALGPYLRAFDVALLPFRLSQAAMAINPVKMLEYLAAGCVVVSTALPDVVRFYGDVALIAESREDFIAKTRKALEENQAQRIAHGMERARGCTWAAMVETMEKALR